MALSLGTHRLGPESGTVEVRTYREGVAQKIGHDLIIDVGQWEATVEVGEENSVTESLTTLSFQVEDSFTARFAFEVVNNSKVPKGVDHTDTITSVTLVYTF